MLMQAMISVTQAQTADLGEESSGVALEMEAIGQETKKLIQQWRDDIAALHRKDEALQVSHSLSRDAQECHRVITYKA